MSFGWRTVHSELEEFSASLIGALPGACGRHVRTGYYRRRLASLGQRITIETGVEVAGAARIRIGDDFLALRQCVLCAADDGRITIGNRVSLATNVVVNAGVGGVIEIGNAVGIGTNCVLRSSAHRYRDATRLFKDQGHAPGTIIIEDDVWVAAGSVLLPGTHIERGAVVGSGSVVSGVVKAYTVVAGNPARVVGKREGLRA